MWLEHLVAGERQVAVSDYHLDGELTTQALLLPVARRLEQLPEHITSFATQRRTETWDTN